MSLETPAAPRRIAGKLVFTLVAVSLGPGLLGSGLLGSGLLGSGLLGAGRLASDRPTNESPLHFNRDIRPILSDNCFQCHGFDPGTREADLRLDLREVAISLLPSGATAIVPGDPDASELMRRITTDDPDDRMPPEDTHKQLTSTEIDALRTWIADGAEYETHWSFQPPRRPALAPSLHPDDAIDHFIGRRLVSEGLAFASEVDRTRFIRRVTLDLTGLPPSPAEVDAFLADATPEAYGRLVDRLLASPRYGEHVGRFWLDAVRYGDTHGLHLDNERSMWSYRDWVIQAYNDNMPFDQFTIWQLAGDLLEEPTTSQLVASGYNRCNITTSEGGSIDEEYLVKYAADRVEAMSTNWLALNLGCASCHDHKFDPISQREFYQLFAFFNSTTEKAMDGNALAPEPFIRVPSSEQLARLDSIETSLAEKRRELAAPDPELDARQDAWEAQQRLRFDERWEILDPTALVTSLGGASLRRLEDGSILATGPNPKTDIYDFVARVDGEDLTAIRLEVLTHESLVDNGPGRAGNSNLVLTEVEAEVRSVADPARHRILKFAEAYADFSQPGYDISLAIDGVRTNRNGWAVEGMKRHEDRVAVFLPTEPFGYEGGAELRVRLRFEAMWEQHSIGRFRIAVSRDESLRSTTFETWHVAGPFPAPEKQKAHTTAYPPEAGVDRTARYEEESIGWIAQPDWTDGKVHPLEGGLSATYLHREVESPDYRLVDLFLGSDDGLKLWHDGRLMLDRDVARGAAADQDRVRILLTPGSNELLLKISNLGGDHGFYFRARAADDFLEQERLVKVARETRTDAEHNALRTQFRMRYSPRYGELQSAITALLDEQKREIEAQPRTLVSREMEVPRDAYLLVRGEYDHKGEKVERGTPSVLPPLPPDYPRDRLGLARWLVDGNNPLVARVQVNRLWQMLFGTGLVKTADDFGSQGEWPTHPELLDWLACEFVDSGWDVKGLLRKMVLSRTYRQASSVTPESHRRDPGNRLLARGPRFRLDAEVIRDSALLVGDLLVEEPGGRGSMPYQPTGLWKAVGYTSSNTAVYKVGTGSALHRRSVYTFIKRTSPPPAMTTFDAPSRETCTVRRERTNTPLAALVLLNDPQFVEAARHLARRILLSNQTTLRERIDLGFRLVTARRATDREHEIVEELLADQKKRFLAHPEGAKELLSVGETPRDASLDAVDHAAWTMVANLLLNLDECITKE